MKDNCKTYSELNLDLFFDTLDLLLPFETSSLLYRIHNKAQFFYNQVPFAALG